MKRLVSILLLIVLLVVLCACGNAQTSNTAAVDEEPQKEESRDGYFEDVVSDVKNDFGETIGEKHSIVAISSAKNKDGNAKGDVTVYFYYSKYEGYKFQFSFPKPDRDTVMQNYSFRIGDDKTVYHMERLGSYNAMSTRDYPEEFEIIYNALTDGNDIVFSVSPFRSSSGDYIFTLHGDGFAELVEAIYPD